MSQGPSPVTPSSVGPNTIPPTPTVDLTYDVIKVNCKYSQTDDTVIQKQFKVSSKAQMYEILGSLQTLVDDIQNGEVSSVWIQFTKV